MRFSTPWTASLPSLVFNRFGLWLMMGALLACSLALPVAACVHSDACQNAAAADASGADLWIVVNGDNVMFKFRGFNTIDPAGSACACGLKMVNSLSSINQAQVMVAGTNTPVSAFNFQTSGAIGSDLATAPGGGGNWVGFATTPIASVSTADIDLVFTGKLKPGQTFNDLKGDLIAAGNILGFGVRPSSGRFNPTLCPPKTVDQIPAAKAAPVIKVGKIGMGHPRTIELSVRDAEEGLATLRALDATHATEASPTFTAGTTAPVVVDFTMAEDQKDGSIGLEACNVKGDCATLRADVVTLKVGLGGLVSRNFSDIPRTRSLIKVQNGDPGATMFILTANEQRFSVRPLVSGQSLDFSAPLALTETENAVTLALRGAAGSEAMVLMVESLP